MENDSLLSHNYRGAHLAQCLELRISRRKYISSGDQHLFVLRVLPLNDERFPRFNCLGKCALSHSHHLWGEGRRSQQLKKCPLPPWKIRYKSNASVIWLWASSELVKWIAASCCWSSPMRCTSSFWPKYAPLYARWVTCESRGKPVKVRARMKLRRKCWLQFWFGPAAAALLQLHEGVDSWPQVSASAAQVTANWSPRRSAEKMCVI